MAAKNQTKKAVKKPSKQTAKKSASAGKRGAQPAKANKSGLFKFRRYKKEEGGKDKKAKHPKLIVDEKKGKFGFMGLTEEPKSGHHKNIPLSTNPKRGDKRKAFIRKELRYDSKSKFGEILEKYNISEKDKLTLIEYIEESKKKK